MNEKSTLGEPGRFARREKSVIVIGTLTGILSILDGIDERQIYRIGYGIVCLIAVAIVASSVLAIRRAVRSPKGKTGGPRSGVDSNEGV